MSTALYLSVLTPSTSTADQSLSFVLTPTDAVNNTPIDITVTIPSNTSEINLAQTIQTQMIYSLTSQGKYWGGCPPLSSSPTTGTFQVTLCDHIVCVWSDSQYLMNLTTSDASCSIQVSTNPYAMTLSEFVNRAPIHRLNFQDSYGNQLSAASKVLLLGDASDALFTYLNNPIASTSYLEGYVGRGGKTLFARVRPGLTWDVPTSRQMWQLVANNLATNPRDLWNWKQRQNELWWRLENSMIALYDPMDIGSEVKWSYTAGYINMPNVIKGAVVEISRKILMQSDLSKVSLGSLKVDMASTEKWLGTMTNVLRKYML